METLGTRANLSCQLFLTISPSSVYVHICMHMLKLLKYAWLNVSFQWTCSTGVIHIIKKWRSVSSGLQWSVRWRPPTGWCIHAKSFNLISKLFLFFFYFPVPFPRQWANLLRVVQKVSPHSTPQRTPYSSAVLCHARFALQSTGWALLNISVPSKRY